MFGRNTINIQIFIIQNLALVKFKFNNRIEPMLEKYKKRGDISGFQVSGGMISDFRAL